MGDRKLWIGLGLVTLLSFLVLGYFGLEIYHEKPPIPSRVVTAGGTVLFTAADIQNGQNVWQSTGGHELGSIWGHGAYVAPDWSADWLHRELTFLLDRWSGALHGKPYSEIDAVEQATLRARLEQEVRTNTYDSASATLTVSEDRAAAIVAVAAHYDGLFSNDPSKARLRDAYAMPPDTVPDPRRRRELTAFFFWAAWSCATERPGQAITYTNNWPAEALIGNRPTGSIILWSVISFIGLLAGVGALVWYHGAARSKGEEDVAAAVPATDPLLALEPTPSMVATFKYFLVVGGLVVAQMVFGAIAAHYGVEGGGFYGLPLAGWLPYSVARTWHLQLGIFWIATAWLATGLFVAPAVSGHEPKFQRLGVNVLFGALVLVVGGSMTGEWLGVMQKLGYTGNFWFGHMGYEYVDLGRFWQILLFVGLLLWFALVVRAIAPAFKKDPESRSLLALFILAGAAIGGFYGAGLAWGQRTNLAIAEYWRWWVVHLWVEGFFEVFATVAIAFLFTRMGLIRKASASRAALFSSAIYLGGGIIGTMHHLYFTGTPTGVLAFGAVFSALEIVPLVLVGLEAAGNMRLAQARAWVGEYRWAIYFFVAVAFWNLVGAGLFGFLINPPIALYFMQGLNTTPVHGHAALFGVYGMLGLGLMLFTLRGLGMRDVWKTGVLAFSFWALNIGLMLMIVLSLLPIGLMQTWASVEHGLWYARSAEFMQTPLLGTLRWMRMIGDTIFAAGMLGIGWFVIGLKNGLVADGRKAARRPRGARTGGRTRLARLIGTPDGSRRSPPCSRAIRRFSDDRQLVKHCGAPGDVTEKRRTISRADVDRDVVRSLDDVEQVEAFRPHKGPSLRPAPRGAALVRDRSLARDRPAARGDPTDLAERPLDRSAPVVAVAIADPHVVAVRVGLVRGHVRKPRVVAAVVLPVAASRRRDGPRPACRRTPGTRRGDRRPRRRSSGPGPCRAGARPTRSSWGSCDEETPLSSPPQGTWL